MYGECIICTGSALYVQGVHYITGSALYVQGAALYVESFRSIEPVVTKRAMLTDNDNDRRS
jgi:hypothetical protein